VSAADALVARLPATSLVVGKGGVGKTTCAAALALAASAREQALLISTDPARALPSVLDQPIDAEATPIAYARNLSAQLLDASALRSGFMERWGIVIRTILDRGTYLDDSDIGPLVDTALPGSDEIFAALELARLLADGSAPRLIVDTAPTGHTLRLLNLPRTFRALVRLLDAMQEKHRFMVRTLTRRYRSDSADDFLAEMTTLVTTLEAALSDPARCGAIVVTNPQSLVVAETRRYIRALTDMRMRIVAVVWNNSVEPVEPLDLSAGIEQYVVRPLDNGPVGRDGLTRWLEALEPVGALRPGAAPRRSARSRASLRPDRVGASRIAGLLRPLTIVAGKGGVGKTTVAAAIALQSAGEARTLVVSTDPAPSLSDAFAQEIQDSDIALGREENLFARQMDASAAFARLREEYQARVDAMFEGLVARGVDLAPDRAIARDLLSLAPPGIDEVYALSLIADALFDRQYARVIVDPAPTGHFLRLLDMPQLALAWSHQLLRLTLKYKEIAGLGDAAQDILAFARNLRALDALLRDEKRGAVVVVTLDEPVVRAETNRLAREIRQRGLHIAAVVSNRARADSAPLPVPKGAVHFQAPSAEPPPIGRAALRRWLNSWNAATHDA
jgi:arsenite-transporting ATPase